MAFDPRALIRTAQAPIVGGEVSAQFFYATPDLPEQVEAPGYMVDARLRKGDCILATMGRLDPSAARHYVVTGIGGQGVAALAQIIADVVAAMPRYVALAPMTVQQLLDTYPANAQTLGKYARVTDLYGSADEILRCCSDGSTIYWRPQRTDFALRSVQTAGTMTLKPLFSAPDIAMASTPTGNVDIALSAVNAWPGCTFRVRTPSSLGLFGIRLTGLLGSLTRPLLAGSEQTAVYTAQGWVS